MSDLGFYQDAKSCFRLSLLKIALPRNSSEKVRFRGAGKIYVD